MASSTTIASIPATTTKGTITGSLSNNGFINPSTNANYTFALTLVNKVPVNGVLKIVNVPALGFTT